MFKIAYCAGHYINTPGKKLPKSLDPNETREWVLNDRVADHFAKAASEYEDVKLLRTDDPLGMKFIDIPERTAKANAWGADLYVDMHHNAADRVFNGGGVAVYHHPNSTKGLEYCKSTYNAIIQAGGLKGDRSNPVIGKRFDSLTMTNMPAILIEYGFMDSTVDAPTILTEAYSKLVAYATMEGIARVAGLVKKSPVIEPPKPTPAPKLQVDGMWGTSTTTRLQQIFGTRVDGIVSNQWASYKDENPGLVSSFDWQTKPNGKGSTLIKEMQKWAGMPESQQDGEIGPATIRAFQYKLSTYVDGFVSKPSEMVKALQRWANEQ